VFGRTQIETTTPALGECITIGDAAVAVAWQVESSILDGASVLGSFSDGSPAITENRYGAGVGVLISSYPSLAYQRSPHEETAQSVAGLLQRADGRDVSWSSVVPGLVTRRATTAQGDRLVFAINWTDDVQHLSAPDNARVIGGDATRSTDGVTIEAKSAALLELLA
jgi:hypothetical protein